MSRDAGPVALLAAVLDHHPGLPGAACRGRGDLFDAPERPSGRIGGTRRAHLDQAAAQRQARALALCRTCPALVACAAWLDGMAPSRRPAGAVMAGRIVTQRRRIPDTNRTATPIPSAVRHARPLTPPRRHIPADYHPTVTKTVTKRSTR